MSIQMISGNLVVQDDVDLRDVAASVSRVAGPGHDVFDPELKKENANRLRMIFIPCTPSASPSQSSR